MAWVDVHCPIDAQMSGGDPLGAAPKVRAATDVTVAVAGGHQLARRPRPRVRAGRRRGHRRRGDHQGRRPRQATGDIRKRAIDRARPSRPSCSSASPPRTIREVLAKVRTQQHLRRLAPRCRASRASCRCAGAQIACGPAVTVRTSPGDWAKPVEAIDVARAGRRDRHRRGRRGRRPSGASWPRSCIKHSGAGRRGRRRRRPRHGRHPRARVCRVWTRAGRPATPASRRASGEINAPIAIGGQRIAPATGSSATTTA